MQQQMTVAINYIRRVKDVLENEPEKYEQFLNILNDYKRIRATGEETHQSELSLEQQTHRRICQLFATKPELIEGFKSIGDVIESQSL